MGRYLLTDVSILVIVGLCMFPVFAKLVFLFLRFCFIFF